MTYSNPSLAMLISWRKSNAMQRYRRFVLLRAYSAMHGTSSCFCLHSWQGDDQRPKESTLTMPQETLTISEEIIKAAKLLYPNNPVEVTLVDWLTIGYKRAVQTFSRAHQGVLLTSKSQRAEGGAEYR